MEVISLSIEQTLQLGHSLGTLLESAHVICLSGELGAGKTTLVRGIGQGWQSQDRVTSPTYVLLNIYRRQLDSQVLYHLDAYRLEDPQAVETIGFDDILDSNGPLLIEWPERIESVLPSERLWIEIEVDEAEHRLFRITAQGTVHIALVEALHKVL